MISGFFQNDENIISELQNKFESIKTLKADFVQLSSTGISNENYDVRGNFFYKKKNKYRIELKDQIIVSDGEKIWNYNKKLNRVVINSATEDPSSLTLDKFIFDYPQQSKVEILKNDPYEKILRITPENKELNFSYAKLWIDKENLIKKVEVSDVSGAAFIFELKDIVLNKKIDDSLFNLNTPEGTKVIDLR